ncbi:MAG: serine--tRNA ligase, partial [Dysgonamonadaceae bacterium]
MLTLKVINENSEEVVRKLAKKHFDAKDIIDQIINLDAQRKSSQTMLDNTLAKINSLSKSIGSLMKEGKKDEAAAAREEVTSLKESSAVYNTDLKEVEEKIQELLVIIPNLPDESVPEGKGADDNIVERSGGTIPALSSEAMPHWELAKKYDIIDFELGVKISGAGFPVYKGKGARLQRSLINFFLDNAREAGYTEIQPPYVVNSASGFGTGQLPDKEGQMYHAEVDDLYLIPTAEVPVTNIYRDVILEEKDLPVRNTAYSACFRREAGSYGKDVRGLNRLHQFDKVEIVCIEKPENSYNRLNDMVAYVQTLVEKLELPWRILRLCGGDMSFTSALTFDFEVF